MPILLRIIFQRIIAAFISLLTFLGISTETAILTDDEVVIRNEEQRQNIEEILEFSPIPEVIEDINADTIITAIDSAAERIEGTRKQIENHPTKTDVQHSVEVSIKEDVEEFELEITDDEEVEIIDVLVNIICTQTQSNFTTASTGSGVIISPKGVVVTNAHVAQFILLEDAGYPVNCALYKENIPTFGYKADVMHISEDWLEDNYKLISSDNPKGTGEKDYAILAITDNTNPVLSLPSQFPYAKINTNDEVYEVGQKIVVGGFPGAPDSIFDLAKAGSLKTDSVKISDVFTFSGGDIDIFSTSRTPVAAKGASGGGIFHDNKLIGVTVTTSKSGSGYKINALTTTYINDELIKDVSAKLASFISSNLKEEVKNFQESNSFKFAEKLYSEL